MLKWILRIKTALVKSLDFAVALVMGVLVLDVLWQVFTRYVLKNQSAWTSELATVLLMWVSLLGASVAFAHKGHLGVDYFVGKLPAVMKTPMEILVLVIVGVFAGGILIYGGCVFVANTDNISPSLRINYRYIYLVLPISGFFILLFAVEMLAEKLGWVNEARTLPESDTPS